MAQVFKARIGLRFLAASSLILGVALAPLPASAAPVPSAPRSLTGVAGPGVGDVTLSWLAPTSSGSSPVNDYGYNVSTDGGASWSAYTSFGSTALSAAVVCPNSGASNVNGKGCRYRVRARNASGAGAPSNTIKTWIVPGAPTKLVGAPTDSTYGSVALSWLAPKTTGGFATLAYSVQSSNDGGAFATVATTSGLSATAPCTGAASCAYRVLAANGQGTGPASNTVTVKTTPGLVQSFSALTQSRNRGTGVSTVNLSWYPSTTGMPADHYELQSCTVPVGSIYGCGPTSAWSATQQVTGPFATPVSIARTCTAGVATCSWRVRVVSGRGGVGGWRMVNLLPWAVTTSTVPGPNTGQVSILFGGPAESGPNGAPKYYTAFICSAGCGSDSSWIDSGLTIAYPPSGSDPYTAGTYACGANAVCQVRMQFTDGRGVAGVLSTAASGRGANLSITAPANGAHTSDATPTIAGTCTIGYGAVNVTVNPGPVAFASSCDGAGAWSADVPSALSDNTYTVSATQTGTLGTSNTRTFTVDTAAPVVTLTTPANGSTTTVSTVSFSGACSEIGTDNVSIVVTGPPSVNFTASCAGSPGAGAWSAARGVPNGSYTAQASQTDAAGNVGSSATNSFTVSAQVPIVTLDTPSNGGYSNSNPTTLSGLCTVTDGTVTVGVSGPTSATYFAACSLGIWSTSAALTDGAYSATATQTDGVGNVGSSGTKTFRVDTVAPVVTASATKADSSTYTAGTWSNQTVTVHYTCSDTGGSGVASCPVDQVFSADGTTASTSGTATDNAGNSASASFGPIKIDKTNPTVAIAFPVTTKKYNAARWGTGCTPVGVCGTAGDALSGLSSVTVTVQRGSDGFYWNGTAFVAGPANATVTGTTSWNAALAAAALTNGVSYTVTATATDNATNSTSAISTFTYDTAGPQVTSATVTNKNGIVTPVVDTLTATFNEELDPTSVPLTATLTLQRNGSGNTVYGISGLTNGLITTGAAGYLASGSGTRTVTFDGTLALSADRKTVTFTVIGLCQPIGIGSPCLTMQTIGSPGPWVFTPAAALLDDAGNGATTAVTFTASPATAMF